LKHKYKKQWKATPADKSKAEGRISELEDEMVIKGKTEELLLDSKPVKGICKNSLPPSKDQT
jgi:hypothetical protein